MVSFARADSESRSGVQAGSQTTFTSTVSTPSSASSASGMAADMLATNGHQPVVGIRSTSTCAADLADVLHHAHVDDRDPAVLAAGVIDAAQGVDQELAVHPLLLSSKTIRKPVVAVARAGSAGSSRAACRPCCGVEVAAAADHAPAVLACVADPFPDVARELLGAARRGAVGVRAHRARSSPRRPRRSCSGRGRTCAPHGHGRSSSPRAAASHSAPVGSRAAEPGAERECVVTGD